MQGLLLLMPSYLRHEVSPTQGSHPRISLPIDMHINACPRNQHLETHAAVSVKPLLQHLEQQPDTAGVDDNGDGLPDDADGAATTLDAGGATARIESWLAG